MQIIPVLDLLDGQVVRGVAGRRERYAPIESQLVRSSSPLDVARCLRETFGSSRLYIADLDAILHDKPCWSVMEQLITNEFELLVDAGLREPARARQLIKRGVTQVIAALETLPGIDRLQDIVNELGPEPLVFSLDLMHRTAMGSRNGWHDLRPRRIVDLVCETGIDSLIVLDLAGVGVGQGIPTLELCGQLMAHHPSCRIITGGGVRNMDDVYQASALGIDGLLVASALHDGSISAEQIPHLAELADDPENRQN